MNWMDIHGIVQKCNTRELAERYFQVNPAQS